MRGATGRHSARARQALPPRAWPAALLAAFVAVTEVVGLAFSRATLETSWYPVWPSPWKGALALAAIGVGFWLVLRAWFAAWDARADGAGTMRAAAGDAAGMTKAVAGTGAKPGLKGWVGRHFLASCAILIALSWLPYLVICLPGSLPWDGARSLNQFLTNKVPDNHHPVVMNALYAALMTLGRALGSDNRGIFLIVCFQSAVCCLAFADSLALMRRTGAPRWLVAAGLAFFCLHPMWGVAAQTAYKDTLFDGIVVLYCSALARTLLQAREGVTRRQAGALLALSLTVCLTRNNGIYLVVPASVGLVALLASRHRASAASSRAGSWPRRNARRAAAVLVSVTALYLAIMNLLWPALGIQTHEAGEALSIPLQQTARYVCQHGDDVTPAEHDAIAAILPYDELASLYIPDLSDPVKARLVTTDGELAPAQARAYLSAWASMGLRHPRCYVEATIANTYAYFYPWKIVGPEIGRPVFMLYQIGAPINTSYDVHYVGPEERVQALDDALDAQMATPVVEALYSPAPYVLLFLALLAYALHRRDGAACVVALPLLMLLLTTLAGPLDGHLRYIMPIAAALPLLAWIAMGRIEGLRAPLGPRAAKTV